MGKACSPLPSYFVFKNSKDQRCKGDLLVTLSVEVVVTVHKKLQLLKDKLKNKRKSILGLKFLI